MNLPAYPTAARGSRPGMRAMVRWPKDSVRGDAMAAVAMGISLLEAFPQGLKPPDYSAQVLYGLKPVPFKLTYYCLVQFDGLNHHLMGGVRLKRTSSAARSASATA